MVKETKWIVTFYASFYSTHWLICTRKRFSLQLNSTFHTNFLPSSLAAHTKTKKLCGLTEGHFFPWKCAVVFMMILWLLVKKIYRRSTIERRLGFALRGVLSVIYSVDLINGDLYTSCFHRDNTTHFGINDANMKWLLWHTIIYHNHPLSCSYYFIRLGNIHVCISGELSC